MSDNAFLDTNVIVYAWDNSEPLKQARARELVQCAVEEDAGAISAQVLSEFFVTVTRKIQNPMTPDEALKVIDLLSGLPTIDVDGRLVHAGIEQCIRYQISYWDGLILAAARRADSDTVYSEDLNDGHDYGGVRVVNPFV